MARLVCAPASLVPRHSVPGVKHCVWANELRNNVPSKTIQLIKAAGRADFRRVALLLRDGARVNGLDKDGTGALRRAVTGLGFYKKQFIKGRLVRIRGAPLEDVYKTVRLLL